MCAWVKQNTRFFCLTFTVICIVLIIIRWCRGLAFPLRRISASSASILGNRRRLPPCIHMLHAPATADLDRKRKAGSLPSCAAGAGCPGCGASCNWNRSSCTAPRFWCPPFWRWLSSFCHVQRALGQKAQGQFEMRDDMLYISDVLIRSQVSRHFFFLK